MGVLGSSNIWGTVSLAIGVALPETARNMVGNGSIEPTGLHKTWISLLKGWRRREKPEGINDPNMSAQETNTNEKGIDGRTRWKFKMPNLWAPIRITFWQDIALILWMAGSPYAVWYRVQASIPTIYQNVYGFNAFQTGLAYLAGGAGTVIGGYANGCLMDWNYKTVAKKIGHTIDKVSGDNLDTFPIERARARGAWWLLAICICALAGYGWSIVAHTHESVPLILQFMLAALCTAFQQTFNALLVDIFPESPSTAAASSNITRCALSAISVAMIQPLVEVIGRGWFFTLLAFLSGGGGLVANWAMTMYGMKFRQQRLARSKRSTVGNVS